MYLYFMLAKAVRLTTRIPIKIIKSHLHTYFYKLS